MRHINTRLIHAPRTQGYVAVALSATMVALVVPPVFASQQAAAGRAVQTFSPPVDTDVASTALEIQTTRVTTSPTAMTTTSKAPTARWNGFNVQPVWSSGGTWNADRYTLIKSKGFDSVRFVLFWDVMQPTQGSFAQLATLDTAIRRAKAAGLKIVLNDIYLGGTNGEVHVPMWARTGNGSADVMAYGRAYLTRLANRYRAEPAVVAHDLVNEPDRATNTAAMRDYDTMIGWVRAVDPGTTLIVEPLYGNSDLRGSCLDPAVLTHRKNVVLSVHDYFAGGDDDGYSKCGQAGSHTWNGTTGYADTAKARAQINAHADAIAAGAARLGIPVWVGEFGIGDSATNHDAFLRDKVAVFEARGWSWTLWDHTGSGPFSATTDSGLTFKPWVSLIVPSGSFTIAAVGDIQPDGTSSNSTGTAKAAASAAFILGLGDYQYIDGTMTAYNSYFDKSWGTNVSKMYPVLAPSHDRYWRHAAPLRYFNGGGTSGYKAPVTLTPHQSYSFDAHGWHFMAIDDSCYRDTANCSSSALLSWVKADLAAHPTRCTIAYWHQAYFTSTAEHAAYPDIKPVVKALYAGGVDVALQGHNHNYERFAPQTSNRVRDHVKGIRAFVVGTGGIGFYPFRDTAVNSVTRSDSSYGVLKMTLGSGSYGWNFVNTGGTAYTDSGSATCH